MQASKIIGVVVALGAGCMALVLAIIGWNLLAGDNSPSQSQNNQVVVIASRTPAVVVAVSDTPIPLPTDTAIPLPTDTPIAISTNTAVVGSSIGDWENTIAVTLEMVTDIDVVSVRIADGRPNGGEVALIVAFSAPVAEQAVGVGSVWGAAGAAIREYSMDIDSLTVIYGVNESSSSAIVTVQVVDLLAFMNEEITLEELLARTK